MEQQSNVNISSAFEPVVITQDVQQTLAKADYVTTSDTVGIPPCRGKEGDSREVKMLSDYALLCAGPRNINISYFIAQEEVPPFSFTFVARDGQVSNTIVSNENIGVCPTLNLNLEELIKIQKQDKSLVKVSGKKVRESKIEQDYIMGSTSEYNKTFIEIGEYPQKAVSLAFNERLEALYNNGDLDDQLKCTGKLYTQPCKDFINYGLKQNPEFEYNGKKYVRFVVNKQFDRNTILANESFVSPKGTAIWLEVSPIKFEVKNIKGYHKKLKNLKKFKQSTLNLECTSSIIGGICMNPVPYDQFSDIYQNSFIRAFLNGQSIENLPRDDRAVTPEGNDFDFSNNGFLSQAFDSSPVKIYNIPKESEKLPDYAFAGCVGLEKIIIHENLSEVPFNAFNGLKNTQIEFKISSVNPFVHRESLVNANLKYIYISKTDNTVTFSPYKDKNLEENCYVENLRDSSGYIYLKENYFKNYVYLHKLKEQGKIKFIPNEYILDACPHTEIENFYVNGNDKKFQKLMNLYRFEMQEERTFCSRDVFKIYYALGGFSKDQSVRDKAFDYACEHLTKVPYMQYPTPQEIREYLHSKFGRLVLDGPYNPTFAEFFMKYYGDNPDFMVFNLTGNTESYSDEWGETVAEKDYLCDVHNNFKNINKLFPHRLVYGNEERSLLTPKFVAEHHMIKSYTGVKDGNESLAILVGKYGYSQEQFDKIQIIYNKAKTLKDAYVICADKSNQDNPITFRVLTKDDPLGFVIGDITNCCQHIGGTGETCVDDGYTNPNAGFLVFEKTVKDKDGTYNTIILGQAYVWYDPITKTVCYDNIEIPTKVLDELKKGENKNLDISYSNLLKAVDHSADKIASAMAKRGIEVKNVTTGVGFNDLKKQLNKKYKLTVSGLAKHRNYDGYSDATTGQYIIKTYNDSTNMNKQQIETAVQESKQNLQDIVANSTNLSQV